MNYIGGILASFTLIIIAMVGVFFARLDIAYSKVVRSKHYANIAFILYSIALLSVPVTGYMLWQGILYNYDRVYLWLLLPFSLIIVAHALMGDMKYDPRTGKKRDPNLFFKPVCLFSAMTGTLLLDGEPVRGARLVRKVNPCKAKSDHTVTDDYGRFHFDALFGYPVGAYIPQEFGVSQNIFVSCQGKEYRLWSGIKNDRNENSEARGNLLTVQCELNSEENLKKVSGNTIISVCTWDAEEDQTELESEVL